MADDDPIQVVRRFQSRVSDLIRSYEELLLAVHEKRRQASLETLLSEQAVMSMAVFWEAFVNDVFVAHVVRAPEWCLANAENRVRQSINGKFVGLSRWVTIEVPKSITKSQAEKILDPKGWNISASSAQELANLANLHLPAPDARKFSLDAEDRAFLDYLVALRNYLAHRSDSSRGIIVSAINEISTTTGDNAPLSKAQPGHIGTYLKERVGADTRVGIIARRMSAVSAKLA